MSYDTNRNEQRVLRNRRFLRRYQWFANCWVYLLKTDRLRTRDTSQEVYGDLLNSRSVPEFKNIARYSVLRDWNFSIGTIAGLFLGVLMHLFNHYADVLLTERQLYFLPLVWFIVTVLLYPVGAMTVATRAEIIMWISYWVWLSAAAALLGAAFPIVIVINLIMIIQAWLFLQY